MADLRDMDDPPHPSMERALTNYLYAADLSASAGETAHPAIAQRMEREADRAREDGRAALAEVTGDGDG